MTVSAIAPISAMACADAATMGTGSRSTSQPPARRAAAIAAVMPVVASSDAVLPAPKAATMPAAWLSTMRPADAARKKTVKSFQNVARKLSWEPAACKAVGRPVFARTTPAYATNSVAIIPVAAITAARPASV